MITGNSEFGKRNAETGEAQSAQPAPCSLLPASSSPGYKTTEFYIALVVAAIHAYGLYKGAIPGGTAACTLTATFIAYLAARLFVKLHPAAAAAIAADVKQMSEMEQLAGGMPAALEVKVSSGLRPPISDLRPPASP